MLRNSLHKGNIFLKKHIAFLKEKWYKSIKIYTEERSDLKVMEKEGKRNIDSIIFKIDKDLKKEFNIKCIENNTNMSEVIVKHIRKYVKNK